MNYFVHSRLSSRTKGIAALCLSVIFIAVVLIFCYLLPEKSTFNPPFFDPLYLRAAYIVYMNLGTLLVLLTVLILLTNRVWLSGLLMSGIVGIISIINFFVLNLHSMPLSFLILKNFRTAANVVENINFVFDPRVITLILFTGVPCVLSLIYLGLMRLLGQPRLQGRLYWLRNGILVTLSAVVIITCYAGNNPLMPRGSLSFQWSGTYNTYGFAACTVESLSQLNVVVNEPDGYQQDAMDAMEIARTDRSNQTPDVVLILNETFYDLRQITDPQTDVPYLSNIESLDNCLRGYAVVPAAGGSTNASEYELLTGNSTYLMPGVTPFMALDLVDSVSIASHLGKLGYTTIAAHSERASNYNRQISYPAMGFQKTYFDEDFISQEGYVDRRYATDESVYKDMLRWYEEAPADTPRFTYVLTIQNHNEWDYNPPEADLVHVGRDYGEYTQELNEYLTSIYMADRAFKGLTEYFENSDRPVIVCMVGDHCPSNYKGIADAGYSPDDLELRLRQVPLVIWANFPLEQIELGTISMNMVLPTLLDLADIALSPYYDYMLQLKQQVPVVSAYGVYYDADGNLYRYDSDESSPHAEAVDKYLCLSYQNTKGRENRSIYYPYD